MEAVKVEKIALELPYIEVATCVFPKEGISKSFLTPFGVIEITIRECPSELSVKEAFVAGDIDSWITSIGAREEFHKTFITFLRQIIERHFFLSQPFFNKVSCRILSNGKSEVGKIHIVFSS